TTIEPGDKAETPAENTESQATEASTLPSPELTDAEVSDIEGSPPEEPQGKKKKKGKEKGGKGKKKKKVEEVVIIEPVEEDEIIYVPKIIQKLVVDFLLHGGFMTVDGLTDVDHRYLYLYRKTEEGIPNFEYPEYADIEMPSYFVIGMVFVPLLHTTFTEPTIKKITSGNSQRKKQLDDNTSLNTRRTSLKAQKTANQIYSTAQFKQSSVFPEDEPIENVDSGTPIKDELLNEVKGFVSALEWVCEHVEDELDLPMTDLADILNSDLSDEELVHDPNVISNLEEVVMGWEKHILKVIEGYLAKVPAGNGPLPEFDYWHERESSLSSLVEQLKKPTLLRISNILEMAKSPVIDGFIHYQVDLKRHYSEAKDNVKFLSTIKRHLKIITYSSDFRKIIDCIPLIIDGLHLIWILSRYYNTDEVMVPFMERIVWCLLEKVTKILNNEILFRKPITEVQKLTSEAQEMLELWYSTYMDTRLKIEESGKASRWEFDKKRLFAASDYMASVCKDLHEVATVIYHFKNIFGAELRAIVIDPQTIDNVAKRVDRLMIQIENTDFDIFSINCRENWEAIMESFHREVRKLEIEGVNFIDQSFKMIRSSESALEMLLKFKHIETREVIQRKLMVKFDVILDQYMKEILNVDDTFTRNKRHPLLCKNQPPHGGAIYWVRLLYYKLKRPILKFQEVKELMESHLKDDAFNSYLKLAKELKSYEETKLEEWLELYGPTMEKAMQLDILKLTYSNKKLETYFKPARSQSVSQSQGAICSTSFLKSSSQPTKSPKAAKPSSKNAALNRSANVIMDRIHTQRNLTWHEIIGNHVLADLGLQFELNFDNNLWSCFKSVEIFESLKFSLPENIRLVAIRKEKLQHSVNAVYTMVKHYTDLVEKLSEPQMHLLKENLREVELHIQPGLTRIKWSSLGIIEFAERCTTLIINLRTLYLQIEHVQRDLHKRIKMLSSANLFNFKPVQEDPERLSCKDFFHIMNNNRTEKMSQMMKVYDSFGPILIKMEAMVLNTNTGKAPAMVPYYFFWENEIYKALITMTISNLESFNSKIDTKVLLFQVDAIVIMPEVVLRPTATEIYNIILKKC
ncbi:hypothetical protein NQ314_013327, partial [Rhamnusium bicolor]